MAAGIIPPWFFNGRGSILRVKQLRSLAYATGNEDQQVAEA